jgi:hypothetical protein
MIMAEDLTTGGGAAGNGNAGDTALGSQGGDDKGDKVQTLEKELQKERSNRGREVSSLKQELQDLKQTIESLSANLSRTTPIHSDDDKPPIDYITTPEEHEIYDKWKADREAKRRKEYVNAYVRTAKSLSHINPELHSEIENELLNSTTKYDSYTNFQNAAQDAEINYRIAESIVLKKKLADVNTTNFKSQTGRSTGTTTGSDNKGTAKKAVELDEYSKRFLDAVGEKHDAEWVIDSANRTDLV